MPAFVHWGETPTTNGDCGCMRESGNNTGRMEGWKDKKWRNKRWIEGGQKRRCRKQEGGQMMVNYLNYCQNWSFWPLDKTQLIPLFFLWFCSLFNSCLSPPPSSLVFLFPLQDYQFHQITFIWVSKFQALCANFNYFQFWTHHGNETVWRPSSSSSCSCVGLPVFIDAFIWSINHSFEFPKLNRHCLTNNTLRMRWGI